MSETIDTDQKTIPAVIEKSLALRDTILEKYQMVKTQEARIKKAKAVIEDLLAKEEKKLLSYHKENGDFEINGYTVKTNISWSTVIKDENQLPGSCFKVKKDVVKSKVKALILEGKINKEVAFQQKSISLKVKSNFPFFNSNQELHSQKSAEEKKHQANVEAMKKEAVEFEKGRKINTEGKFDPFGRNEF